MAVEMKKSVGEISVDKMVKMGELSRKIEKLTSDKSIVHGTH